MSQRDYYEILGVDKGADKKTIKKAYKRLAMKHHPDRNVDSKDEAEKKFKEIQKAYATLSDEHKRQAYDQFGHAGTATNYNGGFGGNNPFGGFEDIFGDIFGRSGNAESSNVGSDLEYDVSISLKEAMAGSSMDVRIPKDEKCGPCRGTGAKKGSSLIKCGTCNGKGQVLMKQGFMSFQTSCPDCHGVGKTIKHKCPDCHGVGTKSVSKVLQIKIPPGVRTGNRIRISGEGNESSQGISGDLYLSIDVEDHEIFTRDGDNLLCEVPITFKTLALGGILKVPTMDSSLNLKIPEGTQSGTVFRLKGHGATILNGSGTKGDLHCSIKVEIPVNLTEIQKERIEKLSDMYDDHHHHPESKSFFEKVTSFFK
jgi:molecular chaperone DnaJ